MRQTATGGALPGRRRCEPAPRALERTMYIAMNHFRVKPELAAEFERAWRERQSYLSEVPGFKSFHLLKGSVEGDAQLYASHTVWKDEPAFMAWTQSEAFQKAHAQGGKTVQMLMGPPRFAGWAAVIP
jgi:heme-degrading monooxygenase HmoA